jgi:hypothetical protein
MSLIDTIADKLKGVFGIHSASSPDAGIGLQRPVTKELKIYDDISLSNDRTIKLRKCTEMRRLDPRIDRMIDKLSGDATMNGLRVVVDSAQIEKDKLMAQTVIDSTIHKTEMHRKLKGWVGDLLNSGDDFFEIMVDEQSRSITRIKKLASIITRSNINAEGNFPDGEAPYYQIHPYTQVKVKEFKLWQIVQISWDYEDGKPYGEPIFASSRTKWDMLIKSEENVVVRRLLRATKRLLHTIGTPDKPSTWNVVNEYKNQNREALGNPMAVYHDYFGNGPTDIKEISGDSQIGDMDDLKYLDGMIVAKTGIPMALLGGGREDAVNRDVLNEQEEDYIRVLQTINDTMEYGLRKIFDFALLLNDINPDSVVYSFKWGSKDRSDFKEKLESAVIMQSLGYDFQTIFGYINLSDIKYEEVLERIRKQVQEGIIPYGLNTKLDTNLANLFGFARNNKDPKVEEEINDTLQKLKSLLEGEISPISNIVPLINQQRRI